MGFPLSFLRFKARPAAKDPPPKSFIDCFYDPVTGKIVARDAVGAAVLFDAEAGDSAVGDYVTSGISSPELLNDFTPATVCELSLPAGDWDVFGFVSFVLDGTTTTSWSASISTTDNTHDEAERIGNEIWDNTTDQGELRFPLNTVRVNLSVAATIYLVATVAYSAGTLFAKGRLNARRASSN